MSKAHKATLTAREAQTLLQVTGGVVERFKTERAFAMPDPHYKWLTEIEALHNKLSCQLFPRD
jgi:hypothetical protein